LFHQGLLKFWFFKALSKGLISLIRKGGTSKEMLSLRYTSLPAFFVTSFYELRLETLETKSG
jgi:hypothetical protein